MEIVIKEDYEDNRLKEKEGDLLAEFVGTEGIKIEAVIIIIGGGSGSRIFGYMTGKIVDDLAKCQRTSLPSSGGRKRRRSVYDFRLGFGLMFMLRFGLRKGMRT